MSHGFHQNDNIYDYDIDGCGGGDDDGGGGEGGGHCLLGPSEIDSLD